jgi:ABC-type antimicrobial peptide transport system permease subunit
MFRHNLLLIYRNFKRFRSTFLINLIGLSTGLACALLIYLWVVDELQMDKFHEKDNRLFTVMANHKNVDNIVTFPNTPGLLAPALLQEIPGIDYAVSTSGWIDKFILSHDNTHVKAYGQFASRDFFNVFSYNLLEGDKVLDDLNSIVICEGLAKKLFNTTENVIGKTIAWEIQGFKSVVTVTGIFADIPSNSSEQFEFLLSFEFYEKKLVTYPFWSNNYAKTFLMLKEGTNTDVLNSKISGFLKSKQADSNITLFLKRYSSQYLYSNYENGVQSGGRIAYVKLFSIIAVFILFIACINFMNLSTAKAAGRIKEVGIKKAVGAHRRTLIFQYLGESTLMTFVSLLLAVLMVDISLAQFNLITGKQLILTFDLNLMLVLLSIILITGIISGSYPALYLSGFNPATVLKGKLNSNLGDLWARKGLVVFQFTLSIILIVAVIVVYEQIEFVQNKNLGYTKDHIIYFEKEGKVTSNGETFISAVKQIPGVISAAFTDYKIGNGGWTYGISWEGNELYNIQYHEISVGYDAIDMLGIEMLEGRTFSQEFPSDSAGIIFNEAAIQAMGLKDPIGKVVQHYAGPRKIVGIAKNFHFESLYNEVKPLFFKFDPANTSSVVIKLEAGKERETISKLQSFYKEYNSGFSFDYKFMDEDYQALYASEQRVAVLSKYFAGLAILISCLGLFGLAAFTAERRMKEIGIRKVLGSSNVGIVYLLSGDFTKMVATAICIALPISYFVSNNWLDNFAFKIELEWWYFIGAGLIALIIAWLTVGTQAIKAARINPAKCLRNE